MSTSYKGTTTLIDIYVDPKSVYDNLKSLNNWSLIALTVMIALTIFSHSFFYGSMTPEWLVNQQLAQINGLSPSELKAAEAMLMSNSSSMGLLSGVFAGMFMLLIVAFYAIYLKLIVGMAGNQQKPMRYGDWFRFSIWAHMPFAINALGLILLTLTAENQDLPISLVNYASVNQLFLGLDSQHVFYTLTTELSLFYIWVICLVALGISRCTDMSWSKASMYAALPYVLVFGIWFIV